ncbi:MAG: hypothetical protein NBV68_04570 [Erythrobacter sp.]|uniref:hypothetical protein n=1 Tax=Erythrobacter sp. TaxID=1042 RepID=UPI0025E84F42|nr:hypothetical protein [Erythrobacter sp.]MCL9998632.1 hypothetical protein [Erythrobacter sp.]
MTEERITETHTPDGNTHTTTTIVTDRQNSGGGTKWIGLLVLVLFAAAALYVFSQMSDSEAAKDAAVGEAAQKVGNAAEQVGEAAEDAVDKVTN